MGIKDRTNRFKKIILRIRNIFGKEEINDINQLKIEAPVFVNNIAKEINEYNFTKDDFNSLNFTLNKSRKKYPILKIVKKVKSEEADEIHEILKEMYDKISEQAFININNHKEKKQAINGVWQKNTRINNSMNNVEV